MPTNLNDLPLRQKIIYGLGGALILVLLFLGVFLLPTLDNTKKLKKQVRSLSAEWALLQGYVQEYRNLPEVKPPPERVSLLSFLEESGRSLQLEKKIVYLKPFTTGGKTEGAELKIENVSGDELIKLIHRIQGAQITITRMNLRDHNMDGLWTAKIFLEG
jgi:type II secretory pathway component PulM